MNNSLSKIIIQKIKVRNKYLKWPSHSMSFWNAVKPFVSNKGAISNENI